MCPKFLKSCKLFQSLFKEQFEWFLINGKSWEQLALPRKTDSLIKTQRDIRLLQIGLKRKRFKLEKLFDIWTDGNSTSRFHDKCKAATHTLCLVQTDVRDQIIGGYTNQTWEHCHPGKYKGDESAFVFSLTKYSIHRILPGKDKLATYHSPETFFVFGNENFGNYDDSDLYIGESKSSSKIGTSYMRPQGVQRDINYAKSYLSGESPFKFVALQAYKVIFI
ncbi:hypothetical protein FGO68_gene10294 [Halteria grandinella]|uniref:TLDc domain-containing protein n=1 Tax=Halteria grandinella TaxID=5974 RepID=A0A8J8NK13_HALGN|nr:hypothetical protein FGO68_gene10294 [Halteria grandinella]